MSPPMPHKPMYDSPTAAQLNAEERDDNGHVTRREFRALRTDVHDIKQALLGENPYDGTGVMAQHHEMRKTVARATKLAWMAVIGIAGLIGTALWKLITKQP